MNQPIHIVMTFGAPISGAPFFFMQALLHPLVAVLVSLCRRRLCAKAFELEQFELAKKYGKNCKGISPLKRLCSQHEWMFRLFLTFRTIKRKLKK